MTEAPLYDIKVEHLRMMQERIENNPEPLENASPLVISHKAIRASRKLGNRLNEPEIKRAVKQRRAEVRRVGEAKVVDVEFQEYIEKLRQEVMMPNCPSAKMELYAKVKGYMAPEKVEVKIGLSADEIARRELEAERRIAELRNRGGSRVESVPKEPLLLPDEVRSNQG